MVLIILLENTQRSVLMITGWDDCPTPHQDVYHISLERPDSVRKVGSTPTRVDMETAACVMGDTLYAVGLGRTYNELWKWNEASDWLRCADMTSYRRRHSVAVVDATLYTLGGWVEADKTTLNSVEAYNTQTNKWTAAGQLTHAVHSAACVTYKNVIYMMGGVQGLDTSVAHVQMYSPAQHSCTLMPRAMPRAMGCMRAVLWETSWDHSTVGAGEPSTWQRNTAVPPAGSNSKSLKQFLGSFYIFY